MLGQGHSHRVQGRIARRVAKPVVDRLEAVHVDEDQAGLGAVPLAEGQGTHQLPSEGAPVENGGQGVAVGQQFDLGQTPLHLFQLGPQGVGLGARLRQGRRPRNGRRIGDRVLHRHRIGKVHGPVDASRSRPGLKLGRIDSHGARPVRALSSSMLSHLSAADRALLDRYLESVLLRFKDEKYNLLETTQELAQAFLRAGRGDPTVLDDMRGLVEAGDDA